MALKHWFFLAALAELAGAVSAAPANPLLRPLATVAPANKPGPGARGALPVPPPPPVASQGEPVAGDRRAPPTAAMRAALARHVVVAVTGDMAVLRPIPSYTGVSVLTTQSVENAAGGQPMMPGGIMQPGGMMQPGMDAGAQNTGTAAQPVARIMPSIVLQHQRKAFVQDAEVLPTIHQGVVTLVLASTGQVVFTGRVEGLAARLPVTGLDTTDSAYVARQSPPVTGSTSTTTSAPAGAAAAQGSPFTGGLR